jgi:hypothetical protein
MAICKLASVFSAVDCAEKTKATGGLDLKVWIGNICDLDRTLGTKGFTVDGNGFVTDINLSAGTILYPFSGIKQGHETNSDMAKNEDGNVFYTHSVILRLQDEDPTAKAALEELANAEEVFAVVQTLGGNFEIYGWDAGIDLESAPKNRARTPDGTSVRTVTLTGLQAQGLEKIFLDTDYATSLTKLEGYETP